MNIIKRLPDQTIKRIAAGEFIISPFCVLKELIENSLDAKSSIIKVNICNNGLDLIKVSDNGFGIEKNYLFLAIEKYATSKILFFNDLYKLKSFGFRGEALSSISCISFFSLLSRVKNQNCGWIIFNSIEKISNFVLKPIFHNVGTTVEVRDIFFNFPIRRKMFLSCNYVNSILLKKLIDFFVLVNFNVKFIFYNNNQIYKIFNVFNKKNVNFINRIIDVYGEKFFNYLKKIKIKNKYFYFYGFFSIKKIKKNSLIFINKRYLKFSNILYEVINSSFCDFFLTKRNYFYLIFFFIRSDFINININPDKSEIEFLNSSNIFKLIYEDIISFLNKKKYFSLKKKCNKKLLSLTSINDLNKSIIDKYFFKNDYLQFFLKNYGSIISIIDNRFVFSSKNNNIFVFDLLNIYYLYNKFILNKNDLFFLLQKKKLEKYIKINIIDFNIIKKVKNIFYKVGIDFFLDNNFFILKCVPFELLDRDFNILFLKFFSFIKNKFFNLDIEYSYWLSDFIINYSYGWSNIQSIFLISKLSKILIYYKIYKKIYKIFNLRKISIILSNI